MNREAIAQELVKLASELIGMEFPTQDAYDKYMKEHPDADKSKHSVVETKKEPAKRDVSIKSLPSKVKEHGVFQSDSFREGDAGFFSHYDEENGKKDFGINKKDSEAYLKQVKPLAEAIMKKHGISGDLIVEDNTEERYMALLIKKPRKNGKKVDDDTLSYLMDDLEKLGS